MSSPPNCRRPRLRRPARDRGDRGGRPRSRRGFDRLRRRRRLGEFHEPAPPREGHRLLAQRGESRGERRARAARRGGRRRHRRHGATDLGSAGEPAAPRRSLENAGPPPRAAPRCRARRYCAPRKKLARELGKTLLVLDTASADAERLYARQGWIRVGVVPGYALWPTGGLCDTTFFYRLLEPRS